MRRIWLVAALVSCAAGCAFDGASGRMIELEPDAVPVEGGSPPGAPAPVTCDGFKAIGGSHYLLFPELLSWGAALMKCAALPGSHLATFESIEEPAAVATGLPLTVPAWAGVEQRVESGTGVGDDWFNRVGTVRLPIPTGFPWRPGEPNDFGPPENREEDFGELQPNGTFDDGPGNRLSRPLCECVVGP